MTAYHSIPLIAVLTISSSILASCQKDRADEGGTPPAEAGQTTVPKDAGTGNTEAKGVQSGSGTRSDYKPTTGPAGVEESKKAPQPTR
jgi:hypothetical protein